MTLSVEDRLDILELLARADSAASRRDADAYVELFTDDAVLDGGMGEHRGKAVLRNAVGPIWEAEGAASVHLTLNAVVHAVPDDSSRALANSILVILRLGSEVSIHSVSAIVQHVVKVDGAWRVERRTVRPAGTG